MINPQRFNSEVIRRKQSAELLADNEAFIDAVNKVMTKYATLEEDMFSENDKDLRDSTAKMRQYAMMRKTLMDVLSELNSTIIEGKNAEYTSEHPSY